MRKYLWLLIVFAACDSADQNTEAEEVLYRTAFVDHAYDAAALPDGSLIVAGATEGRIGLGDWTNAFPLLLRVDPGGAVSDTAVYRDVRYGDAVAAVPLGDGLGVLVTQADYDDSGAEPPTLTLHRARADGTRESVLFERSGSFPTQQPLLRTADGGFALVLSRIRVDADDIVKLDGSGAVSWTYRMPEVQDVRAAAEAPDGSLFVLGVLNDSRRFVLARLDPSGEEVWRQTYGNDTLRRAVAVAAVDGGVAVLGSLNEPGPGVASVVVTRFDERGDVLWERRYATGSVAASALTRLPGGGLAFGYTERYGERGTPGQTRSFVVRLSPNGEERWRQAFGPARGTTFVNSVVELASGRLAAVGSTGPEFIGGYGGDDFDVLTVLYERE